MIYSVPCKKCGVRYIGETGEHFCQRTKQHQNDIKNKKMNNGFYAHLRKNKGHSINWDGTVFLDREALERKEDQGSFVHQCSESGEGSSSQEDIEFGKRHNSGPSMGRIQ